LNLQLAEEARMRQHLSADEAVAMMVAQEAEDADAAFAAALFEAENYGGGGRGRRHHRHAAPPRHPDAVADVDSMGYEELLALGERIGYATRPNKPTASQLDRLPLRIVPESGRVCANGEDEECAVCCDSYAAGDQLRTLPCLHVFHARCIDEWLLSDMPGARECPVCHSAVEL